VPFTIEVHTTRTFLDVGLTLASWEQLSSVMSAEGLTGVTPPRRPPQ
jgi:hypothetical protein